MTTVHRKTCIKCGRPWFVRVTQVEAHTNLPMKLQDNDEGKWQCAYCHTITPLEPMYHQAPTIMDRLNTVSDRVRLLEDKDEQ